MPVEIARNPMDRWKQFFIWIFLISPERFPGGGKTVHPERQQVAQPSLFNI
jgi:hypothetical protein